MKYLALAIALPVILVFSVFTYWRAPSVFSEKSARGMIIHCEVLGEYPSDVGRIEIAEAASGRIVWRVQTIGKMFQLHRFEIVAGANTGSFQAYWGKHRSDIPAQGAFYLRKGTTYDATICEPGLLGLCRATRFTL